MRLRLQHEKDPNILRQAATLLERENERLIKRVVDLTRELLELQGEPPEALQQRLMELDAELKEATRDVPASTSEQRKGNDKKGTGERKLRKGHGHRAQPDLPKVPKVCELDEADRVCKLCGLPLQEWEGQAETSTVIHVISRQFVMQEVVQKKYRCTCGGCVETAPGPLKLFPGAHYSIEFAIEAAADKYLDHLPLERQVRRMGREGLVIDSQTLWDQTYGLFKLHHDLPDRLLEYILSHAVVWADETRWRIASKKVKPEGGSKWWQMWTAGCDDAAYFTIEDSRSADAAEKILGGYAGQVMCDGYTAYETLRKRGAAYVLAHCWAHARRAVLKAEKSFPTLAQEAVELIGELYRIEGEAADDVEARRRLRDEQSRGIVRKIQEWMYRTWPIAPPDSSLSDAIAYIANIWSGLIRFLEDPRLPIDNNAAERALRGPVVGRKNFYGNRSTRGTEVASFFYTVFESAKLAKANPKAYLLYATLAKLRGEQPLLPHEWVKLPIAECHVDC